MNKLNKEYKVLTNIAFNNVKEAFEHENEIITFSNGKGYNYNYDTMRNKDFLRLLEEEKDEIYEIIEKQINGFDIDINEELRDFLNDDYSDSNAIYNILDITFKTYLDKFIFDFRSFEKREQYEYIEEHEEDFYNYISLLTEILENSINEIDEDFLESIEGMTEQQIIEVYELNYSN